MKIYFYYASSKESTALLDDTKIKGEVKISLHRYGTAILLYLVLLGCKKLITRHSHT